MANREAILGRKVGMTQLFAENGEVVPVTVIEAGPCYVTQIKTEAVDGYNAIQIGFGPAKRLNKPERGHLGDRPLLKHLREIRTDDVDQYQVGQILDIGRFAVDELVDVIGTSKGKGFAGVVKRYHFAGGPKTHGQSDRHRAPGASGAGTTPGHVFKGTRRSGHMGNERKTTLNLRVVMVDVDRNLIGVHGAVPGTDGGLVMVRKAAKTRAARKKRALQG
ncbi:MAG: 50S ribosomal protein L3 [Anaerolineae bacterium]